MNFSWKNSTDKYILLIVYLRKYLRDKRSDIWEIKKMRMSENLYYLLNTIRITIIMLDYWTNWCLTIKRTFYLTIQRLFRLIMKRIRCLINEHIWSKFNVQMSYVWDLLLKHRLKHCLKHCFNHCWTRVTNSINTCFFACKKLNWIES